MRRLLEEIGVDYHPQSLDFFRGETQSAEYLAINPFGKIPTLGVDEGLIYETVAITPSPGTWR